MPRWKGRWLLFCLVFRAFSTRVPKFPPLRFQEFFGRYFIGQILKYIFAPIPFWGDVQARTVPGALVKLELSFLLLSLKETRDGL